MRLFFFCGLLSYLAKVFLLSSYASSAFFPPYTWENVTYIGDLEGKENLTPRQKESRRVCEARIISANSPYNQNRPYTLVVWHGYGKVNQISIQNMHPGKSFVRLRSADYQLTLPKTATGQVMTDSSPRPPTLLTTMMEQEKQDPKKMLQVTDQSDGVPFYFSLEGFTASYYKSLEQCGFAVEQK